MKLVLASQGFTNDTIAHEVSKLVGKKLEDINIAIINEAYVATLGTNSKRWLIEELSNIAKYIGGNIDFVNFRAYDKEKIKNRLMYADLIYIVGGKQLILYKLFKETDTLELLKKIAVKKVIMGTSAGSVVLGSQIQSKDYWKERYGLNLNEIENEGLNLIDINIIPHYLREDHKKWDEKFFERVLKDNPFPVYAIQDTQAVIYNSGDIYVVGGNVKIFGNNKNTLT